MLIDISVILDYQFNYMILFFELQHKPVFRIQKHKDRVYQNSQKLPLDPRYCPIIKNVNIYLFCKIYDFLLNNHNSINIKQIHGEYELSAVINA